MVPSLESRLVTKADAAGVFGVCVKTIDNYIKEGLLPKPVQFASKEFWHPEDFRLFIDETFRRRTATPDSSQGSATSETTEGLPAAQRPAKPKAPRSAHPATRARASQEAKLSRLNADG